MGVSPSASLNGGDHRKKTRGGGRTPSSFGSSASSRWWCFSVGKGFYGGGGPWQTSWGGQFSESEGGVALELCGDDGVRKLGFHLLWSKSQVKGLFVRRSPI
jgi:hypothetical protein